LKTRKLTKNTEFKSLFLEGRRSEGKSLNFIYLENGYEFNRLAVIVKKEIGFAVQRNKIKRRIKEAFRRLSDKIKPGYDIIIMARKGILYLNYWEISEEISRFLSKERLMSLS